MAIFSLLDTMAKFSLTRSTSIVISNIGQTGFNIFRQSCRSNQCQSNSIVFTSGGKGKLSCYRALGVQEVWFWEDGLFVLYNLGADGDDRPNRSKLLPELDFDLMNSIADAALEFDRAWVKVKGRFPPG